MVRFSCSLAQWIALDVGNRMICRLTGFDQICVSYGQSCRNTVRKTKEERVAPRTRTFYAYLCSARFAVLSCERVEKEEEKKKE